MSNKRQVDQLLTDLQDALVSLRRGVAGYSSMANEWATATGKLPKGARPKPPSILTHTATMGKDAVEVRSDLKRIKDPAERARVMQAICTIQQEDMRIAYVALRSACDELGEYIDQVSGRPRKSEPDHPQVEEYVEPEAPEEEEDQE